jgi:DNA invertase Pin-like site-specific DNA recombinase
LAIACPIASAAFLSSAFGEALPRRSRRLNRINEYVSFRENDDTAGPLDRAIVVIIGAIAELEFSLIVKRVGSGMRRARLEDQHIGRQPQLLYNVTIRGDRH